LSSAQFLQVFFMRPIIFFVDDEPLVLKSLDRVFRKEPYEVTLFQSPQSALAKMKIREADVVVSDQRMPEMPGSEFLARVKALRPDTVRLMLTGQTDLDAAVAAINQGNVFRFISKPWDDRELRLAVHEAVRHRELILENRRLLDLTRQQNATLRDLNRNLERKVRERTRLIGENERALKAALERLKRTIHGIVGAMALTVETRDPYTAGHQERVGRLARSVAQRMGLSEDRVEGIGLAGSLHDLGKIYVPAEILNRPGGLTDLEFELIKTHPQVGYDILKRIEFPWPIAGIVHQHHERLDGSGYPLGLKGHDILLEARIVAVADVVEAIASHRPYRPALGVEMAVEELRRNRGVRFDPDVVDACLEVVQEPGFAF